MFLIRTAFWLAVIIFFIPVDDEIAARDQASSAIGTFEAIGAAQATWSDVSGFCERNPDVCNIGGRVAHTFKLKAQSGALLVLDFFGEDGEADAPRLAADQGTLKPEDLVPNWRGPGDSDGI